MATSTKKEFITLASLFSIQFLLSGSCSATKLTIRNKCNYTVWPGLYSEEGAQQLSLTGFVLKPSEYMEFGVPDAWRGWLWARTLCSENTTTGRFSCATGDCGSSTVECGGKNTGSLATLAEFAMNSTGGRDLFYVSLMNGFNIPMSVETRRKCRASGCVVDLNVVCPMDLKVFSDGVVVACNSSLANSQFFKAACPFTRVFVNDPFFSTCDHDVSDGFTINFCPRSLSLMKPGKGKSFLQRYFVCFIIGIAVVVAAFVVVFLMWLCCGTRRAERNAPNTIRPPVNTGTGIRHQELAEPNNFPPSPNGSFTCIKIQNLRASLT